MKWIVTVLTFVVFTHCQKKLSVVPDTSSVDILVQTANKTVTDFYPSLAALQNNLNAALKAVQVLKAGTQSIPQEAKAQLIATTDDILATSSDIEKLTGKAREDCITDAVNATYKLRTNSVNSILSCVKRLTDLDDVTNNLVSIQTTLQLFITNTSYASLQTCVPKTSNSFNFFETLKIKTCLSIAVSSYKDYVNDKTSAIDVLQENVNDLSNTGVTSIKDCLKTVGTSTKASADEITNGMIKCAEIIPDFLANVTLTIKNVNETLTVGLEHNVTQISNLTRNSLGAVATLNKSSKEKLENFKEYITDAIVNLKPYGSSKFIADDAFKDNIFSVVEMQITELVQIVNENQAYLYNDTLDLTSTLNKLTSDASDDKLKACLLPEGKSSIAIVDCLTSISDTYSQGINKLIDVSKTLNVRYDDVQKQVVSAIRYATKKIEKLSITSKDTAEFLYDKSGIELKTLVNDQLELLLSPGKNSILSQINVKFELLVNAYDKIEAFKNKVKNKVPENVASTGQPIREAIELLAIINPNRDYGFLYTRSLNIVSDAESKVYTVINEILEQTSEKLFIEVGLLNENYNNRLVNYNSSGYACIHSEDAFFTCVAKCLKNSSINATEYFKTILNETGRLLVVLTELPKSAEVSINLAIKQIVETSTNESIKQAGTAFRDSNMTKDEYFSFISKEIRNFNRTLMPQLLEIGDVIIDNADKVYEKQFATLQNVRPKISVIIEKVNTAVDDILFLYPSAPINNKTMVALSNTAFDRVYRTFNVVVLPANNLTEVGKALQQQARDTFDSVSEQTLRTKCYDIYPVLEDAITCLSNKLNNMTAEINKLTETLYAVSATSLSIRNDARDTLNDNKTAELLKLEADSFEIASSYYTHYSVNHDAIYTKVNQVIQKALSPVQKGLLYNITYLNSTVNQLPSREDKARYEINRVLTASTAFLLNAINAVRYQSNPKLLGNQLEMHTNLTENYTRIIEPYIPKYKGEIDYLAALFSNYTAQYNTLLQYATPENINSTCSKSIPIYVYSKCVRNIGETFIVNLQKLLAVTSVSQSNASSILQGTEPTLRDLLNGIVANLTNYNLQVSKGIAEDLYTYAGFSVESIFRLGMNTNNRSYFSTLPTIQKLASDNSKIVETVSRINFKNVFPLQSRLDQYVNSITSAFKRAIAMSDGLTMENEGAKAQQLADDFVQKYNNYTNSIVARAVELGGNSDRELAIALTFVETTTLKYLNENCPVTNNQFPISDANVCSNSVSWNNSVNTKNKLNLITGYNNELVAINNTVTALAQKYGNKLTEEFAAYSQPVIDKLYTWAGL